MTDIVERLRDDKRVTTLGGNVYVPQLSLEAAAEIERLRNALWSIAKMRSRTTIQYTEDDIANKYGRLNVSFILACNIARAALEHKT